MVQEKLSNIVFAFGDFMNDHLDVAYRVTGAAEVVDLEAGKALQFSGCLDFLTYFNSCAVAKWKQYAQIDQFGLHLDIQGDDCRLQFVAFSKGDDDVETLGRPVDLAEGAHDISIPANDKQLVGFMLACQGQARIKQGWYYAQLSDGFVPNNVRLALSTTTFRKENYIVPNIQLVKSEVLASDETIADNFHMFVVDNGRTLDAEVLSGEGVTVIPNMNVGGAGGFARGMMAALDADETDKPFTHILLMDDDVNISTESLKRTFNLLRLAQGSYKGAFLNGAMLAVEAPNELYEDVAQVLDSGIYQRVGNPGRSLRVDDINDVALNVSMDVEVPNAYGAWWYSCIPMEAVRKNGLPLPLFVRCDDVEYGLRCQGTYMAMNGICVWHEGFFGRFRPSVDCYQHTRNSLIMAAVGPIASQDQLISRADRDIKLYMRSMNYDAVELLCDAVEDYLKGPEFIEHASGEQILMGNSKKNEKLVPLEELDVDALKIAYNADLLNLDRSAKKFRRIRSVWRSLPYDRHQVPDFLLSDNAAVVPYNCWTILNPRSVGKKTLVAMDLDGRQANVRTMDKQRYKTLKTRWKTLLNRYQDEGAQVRDSYKQAFPYLTSREFWDTYLGLNSQNAE